MDIFQSIYPFTQEVFAEYVQMDESAVSAHLKRSVHAFEQWSHRSFAERSEVMLAVSGVLLQKKEQLAQLISREMGKILPESIAEIEKCASTCAYFARHAEEMLQPVNIQTDYQKSFISYQPIGTVLAIMPWNFPFWQLFRFAAPTLMAGNVVLLKHAPNVCGCALAIQAVFEEAGAIPGLFQSLVIDTALVEKILENDAVQAVSLTGSEKAGGAVSAIAARNIKKSVLELGGSDPFIVLADADLEKAISTAIQSRLQNAGQSCIAAKRFIVVPEIMDDFLNGMLKAIKACRQGDPFLPETTMGPMARIDLAGNLQRQLNASVDAGANLLYGGQMDGCNVQPILLAAVVPGMPAFDEESFGPLAAVVAATDEQDAIALANQTRFGLGATVFTRDMDKAFRFSEKIQSGAVFINTMVKSDPRLPFGGIKKSGYGRELAEPGIHEFVNLKTIAIH